MSKITKDDIIGPTGLGFTKELYSVIAADDAAFNTFVEAIITEQAAELAERVGSTVYAAAANLTYLKRAEKCLTAAELIQRRINIILANIQATGNEIGTKAEADQRREYLTQAEGWIAKLAQGITTDPSADFASGSLVTDHFGTVS
jgi:glycerol-3-phosphate dehydrogenase